MDATKPEKPEQEVTYTWGYGSSATGHMARRSAAREAAFFLPYLRPGMRLLDCGCGPGTITIGLAQAVAPGETVAIDLAQSQLDLARKHAAEQGIASIHFEQTDVNNLNFPDASFDAAFFHTVLGHVGDPVKVLREIHRVLKPGGIVGIREFDESGIIHYPSNPVLTRRYDLYHELWRRNGGDPSLGRKLRQVLREAGFAHSIGSASCQVYGSPEDIRYYGESVSEGLVVWEKMDEAVKQGLTSRQELEQISAAWKVWSTHPDAFIARIHCEAVGQK